MNEDSSCNKIENEFGNLKRMHSLLNEEMAEASQIGVVPIHLSLEEKKKIDDRSIYVSNVDHFVMTEDLKDHFHGCGSMNRISIQCNKANGHPKGFAYIEFVSKDYVKTALAMNDTLLRGRQIKVMPKRTNRPGLLSANRFQRGIPGRLRGVTARGGCYQCSCPKGCKEI